MRLRLVPLLTGLSACLLANGNCVAGCWEAAAAAYGHSPLELAAIACVESSLNAHALNRSHQSRTNSVGIGAMQIDSRNVPGLARALGIGGSSDLWDACTNIKAGAHILAEKKARYGNTWDAVGAYNASCTQLKGEACKQARSRYAWKVYRARTNLERTGRCG